METAAKQLLSAAAVLLAACHSEGGKMSKFTADAFPDPALRQAAEYVLSGNRTEAVALARQSKSGINSVGPKGDTVLLVAVVANDSAAVEALTRGGADPNLPTQKAPIAVAMEMAGPKVILALLDAGADPNGVSGSEPAIWRAALFGRKDIVEILAKARAHLNKTNQSGESPMVAAVQADNFSTALLLTRLGASPFIAAEDGTTVGTWILESRLSPVTPEGIARGQLVEAIKAKGYPWPPPSPEQVLAAKASASWPQR